MSNYSRNEFFIGGEWVKPSSSRRFEIINATTEESLGSVPEAVQADVDRAVAAARHAFDKSGWATSSVAERAATMGRFAEALTKRADQIARLVSMQNGMPSALAAMFEGSLPVGLLGYYAELISSLQTEEKRPSQMGKETIVTRSPIGVVAAIVPWNYPVALAMSKIAPAMAAGCTVVIKPSPGTVLDSYLIAEAAIEAKVPAGVINWVAADREVGAYLVSHPGVDKVAFTGSTAAGRLVARACGELLRPVTLELGGKSAAVILDDADMSQVLANLPMVSLINNGQTCFSCTRILAPANRYKDIVDAIASTVSGLTVGDPLDAATHIGPMASSAHRDRVEGFISKGKAEGRLVVGGGRPQNLKRGWFVQPTVFSDVNNESLIAREEIFGPVLAVIPYKDEADAIRIANDTIYGLGGTVWSADPERALRVASRVQTGTVGINGYAPSVGSPFGGVKASGLGRELGPEALSGYQQLKSTYVMG
ncbi:aldehyde dehydrogenase [Stenotrophobium rhamnosiphilum]|uniref:Aldehyde dehydrogenase n=1 Tax=Stenotrophobium rhamnosiphilum TaxID=2029166 RepID=A0A2T5MEC5_9GAMM|nr:aldehyde dehydrogenase [Stenotrophobium rhamnosiphilum]PTU30916.1 aldehyde dehydrogenase [Stenotrophobium rhamnosiphilum]